MNQIKILVTVGTTPFVPLTEYFDRQVAGLKTKIQCGDGPLPSDVDGFRFSKEIEKEIDNADLVVTHAGAGSVYKLLEKQKPLLVVPNLERRDQHQAELANYVRESGYAMVEYEPWAFEDQVRLIGQALSYTRTEYVKDPFNWGAQIASLVKGLEGQ